MNPAPCVPIGGTAPGGDNKTTEHPSDNRQSLRSNHLRGGPRECILSLVSRQSRRDERGVGDMANYTLREEQGVTKEIECETLAAAREEAHEWAREGSYGDIESTIWVDTQILDGDGDRIDSVTTAIDPEEPDCEDCDGHDWQSPIELVGGIECNPGVFGNGGGVVIVEACMHCGCKRSTDTYAQRLDTGEQGLESLTYEEGAFQIAGARFEA